MVVVGIAWVVLTPYCIGLIVASSKRANRLVASHLALSTTFGWSAIAALLGGVFLVGGDAGFLMAACAAPFAGLAFWAPGRRRDDGRGGPDQPDREPGPGDSIDWDRFMRDLDEWKSSRVPA